MKIRVQILLCLIVTLPAAHGASVKLGDLSGTSGYNSIDIQSLRDDPSQVAGGEGSVTIGAYNAAETDFNTAVGAFNQAMGVFSYALGYVNYVYNNDPMYGGPSMAFGAYNNASANRSFAFGEYNYLSASRSMAFGRAITNNISDSVMIGPSDEAKIIILPSGNVGIGSGNMNPTAKLHVDGDFRVTGSIINPMLGSSGSGSTSRLRVGGTVNPSVDWQGSTIIGADGQNKVITGYLAGATNGAVIGARNTGLTDWADLSVSGANLSFRIGESEKMRISSAGNVGIGTTTAPAAKLDVNGDAKVASTLTVDGATVLNSNLTVNGLVTKLRLMPQGDIDMGTYTVPAN